MAFEQIELSFEEAFTVLPVQVTSEGTELLEGATEVYPIGFLDEDFRIDSPQPAAPVQSPGADPQAHPSTLTTPQKVDRAIDTISKLLAEKNPLAVAYSGGKDSSVMGVLVIEAARRLREQGAELPPILFTHANTGIENPAMHLVVQVEIERIRSYAKKHDLPIQVDIAQPSLNDSWAVRIISGRALPTFANSSSRDCSVSWKIIPQKRQRKAVFKQLKEFGEPIVLVGTRFVTPSTFLLN